MRQSGKKYLGSPSQAPELSQSQIAGYKKHHHDNTHYVENIVHAIFTFLSRDRIYPGANWPLG
jgi:hypothetical protein